MTEDEQAKLAEILAKAWMDSTEPARYVGAAAGPDWSEEFYGIFEELRDEEFLPEIIEDYVFEIRSWVSKSGYDRVDEHDLLKGPMARKKDPHFKSWFALALALNLTSWGCLYRKRDKDIFHLRRQTEDLI